MAMAMVIPPAMERELNEEEEQVEGSCELETKRRRGVKVSTSTPAMGIEDAAVEVPSVAITAAAVTTDGEESRSVCLDEDKGSKLFDSGSTALRSTETVFVVAEKKLENGNSEFEDTLNDLQSISGEEENKDFNHIKVGNGLNSYIDAVKNGEDVIMMIEHETNSQRQNGNTKMAKLDVAELDLEKVLDEQETHDLFCPNCRSCITKRVILRKRKVRFPDVQHEERPEKLRQVEPIVVADTSSDNVETSYDNEPDVFRCLSCFSFFIPTENGFNVFRMFRRREQIVNVQDPNAQNSGQISARDGNWFYSIFKPESSRNKGKEPAAQVPVKLKVPPGGDLLPKENIIILDLPISEATKVVETHATIGHISSEDDGTKTIILSQPAISGIDQSIHDVVGVTQDGFLPHEEPIVIVEPSSSKGTSQKGQKIGVSAPLTTVLQPFGDVQIHVGNEILVETNRGNEWEALKSIVYGGLIESITSLGVVSSAVGAQTSTLNVVAIGFANLIGGFLVILHKLSELKSTAAANQKEERAGQYWKLLGRRANFGLHASVAIISYLLFGLLPPVIYGFSFRVSDNKEYKLIAVAAVSLLCIALLAIGKAHVSEPKSYIKTFLYYIGLGFTASGLSYVAGVMTDRFLEQLGLFEHNAPFPSPPSVNLFGVGSGLTSRESE